jgi:hypothetical protein
MKNEFLINLGISIIMICVLIGITVLILSQMGIQIQQSSQITYEKCCGGVPCSDTYYDEESKSCKNVFEERNNYYPYSKFSLLYLIIAFGTALILTFAVRYFIPYPEMPVDESQHFDSFDTGEPR